MAMIQFFSIAIVSQIFFFFLRPPQKPSNQKDPTVNLDLVLRDMVLAGDAGSRVMDGPDDHEGLFQPS